MGRAAISNRMVVADLLAQWPETAAVFVRRRMACVGCTMAAFDTLAAVSEVYGFGLEAFLAELRNAVPDSKRPA